MPTIFEQRERAARITAAVNQFVANTPEFEKYNNDFNIDAIIAYIRGVWGGESKAVESVSVYEIAFQAMLPKLKPIAGFVEPISDELRARVRNTTGDEFKRAYNKVPEFKRAFEIIADEEKAERDACAANPFRRMSAAYYKSIPPVRAAQLYAEDPNFKSAVLRLIDAGEI